MAGRRGLAATEILAQHPILTDQEIRAERIVLGDLHFNDKLECINWLVKHRLLKNIGLCSNCDIPMSFIKRTSVADGYRWQCKRCRRGSSIKNDSFFAEV